MEQIMKRMENVPDEKRTARFVAAVGAVFPDGSEHVVLGAMEGVIARGIFGLNGFGYDPFFYLPEYGKTSAELTEEELRELYSKGNISKECYGLILDIDNMAGQLTSLRNRGVPVLWRPLPEGCGDWYWSGAKGSESYKWLWKLIYDRFTKYFELDNLIWIWNGQSNTAMVDKRTFDIASVDLYFNGEKDYGSRFYEEFAAVQKFTGTDKLIAISECGSVPDMDTAFRDNAVWSFFGVWYGKYVQNEKGEYNEEFTSKDALIRAYNSDGAMTLDEYQKMRGIEPKEKEKEAETSSAPTTTAK
jgi:mannan endo-1,4-beta-mannosidase